MRTSVKTGSMVFALMCKINFEKVLCVHRINAWLPIVTVHYFTRSVRTTWSYRMKTASLFVQSGPTDYVMVLIW